MRNVIVLACAGAAMTAGLLAGRADAATGVGHSGWYWGSPLPQGNALAAVDFSGGTGYAVGGFGTVVRSPDGGATWTGLGSGLTTDLTVVDAVSAGTVVVGGQCALRRSDDGGQTFRRLPWTASDLRCSSPIRAVRFPSASVGYLLLDDGTLLRTGDGGRTWARRAVPGGASGTGVPVRDIQFTGEQAGVAITLGGAGISRTTDGGATWTAAAGPFPFEITGIDFPSATTGYASASGGVLKSLDGGASWAPIAGAPGGTQAVRCLDADTCLYAVGFGLSRMTGGGATFAAVSVFAQPTGRIALPAPAGGTRAVAVSGDRVAASVDGGATWSAIGGRLPDGFSLRSVRGTSAQVAQAFGPSGQLALTVDGGQTWREAGVPATDDVVAASFPDASTGFVLNAAGDLFATENGGASWRSLFTGATPPRSVLALDDRRVLLIGPAGAQRSADGGGVFDPITAKEVAGATLTAGDRAGAAAILYGPRRAVVSTDGGRRWSVLRLPSRATVRGLDFVTAGRGVVVDGAGRLWRTANGGRAWTEILATGTAAIRDVALGDAGRGFLAVDRFGADAAGYVLRTADGGASFAPQLVSRLRIGAGQIAGGGASGGIALDAGGRLFGTSSGGSLPRGSTLTIRTAKRFLARRELRRAGGRVTVTGRLPGAAGGEIVTLSARRVSGGAWRQIAARVTGAGTFAATFSIAASTAFVAQWRGDDARNGDGTPALIVRVR